MTGPSQENQAPLSITLVSGESEATPDLGARNTEWHLVMRARVAAELPRIINHFKTHGRPMTSATIHDRSMPAPDDNQVV